MESRDHLGKDLRSVQIRTKTGLHIARVSNDSSSLRFPAVVLLFQRTQTKCEQLVVSELPTGLAGIGAVEVWQSFWVQAQVAILRLSPEAYEGELRLENP
jgi:hypothetical protein